MIGRFAITTGATAGEWDNEDTGLYVGGDLNHEEGTWTPEFYFGGAQVGLTYAARTAYYMRVGNFVHAYAFIFLSAKGSSTGVVTITGLPHVPAQNMLFTFGANGVPFVDYPTALMDGSRTSIQLGEATAAGGWTAWDDTDFGGTETIYLNFSYPI